MENERFVEEVIARCILFSAMFLIFIAGSKLFGVHYEINRGAHSGYVTAVQKNGVFFKTWRAYVKTELAASQEDIYCVENEEIANKLSAMVEKNEKGLFLYKRYFAYGVTLCSAEDDMIYGVK